MSPKGLLNSNGNYILQHADAVNLLKYVWAAVLLPLSEADYRSRLQISNETAVKLSDVIKPLIDSYSTMQAHCQIFKDKTYPNIVSIASEVYDYAENAGGTANDSYYAHTAASAYIFQCIKSLDSVTSQAEEQKLRQKIHALVDMQLQHIDKIRDKCQTAVDDLRTFEEDTQKDLAALTERSDTVHNKLVAENGSLADMNKKLTDYRTELKNDEALYEHDKIVACTTLTYYWIPLLGIIVAPIVAGIYGDKAVKMAARIDEVNKMITDYVGKIKDETLLVADLSAINSEVSRILKLIAPTIAVIEKMLGMWQSIAEDLKSLKEMVNTNVRDAASVVAELAEAKIVAKWNILRDAVDKYRKAAYVSDVGELAMSDLSKQLHEQGTKSSA
ncbi:hypothetical protein HDZ31DRAFT_33736 [Schizophyllum fasciatum]